MQFRVFSLGGIPVDVSLWALLMVAWLSLGSGGIAFGIAVGGGLFLSVLIHEYGHALVASAYGLQPGIVLHALGGTTYHQRARTDGNDALIIAAGPGLQLAASAVAFGMYEALWLVAPELAANPYLQTFYSAFLWVGVVWAVINLLPMWPMDGGKLFRLGLLHLIKLKPLLADRVTHVTGIVFAVAVGLAYWLLLAGSFGFFVLLIFGIIVFQNVMAMRTQESAGPVRRQNRHAKNLFVEARTAFANENWREAARIGHQIRAEPEVPDKLLDEIYEIIALAHIFDGKLEEGVRFARRAPPTPRLVAAQVKALVALDRRREAREVLEERGDALPEGLRGELEAEAR